MTIRALDVTAFAFPGLAFSAPVREGARGVGSVFSVAGDCGVLVSVVKEKLGHGRIAVIDPCGDVMKCPQIKRGCPGTIHERRLEIRARGAGAASEETRGKRLLNTLAKLSNCARSGFGATSYIARLMVLLLREADHSFAGSDLMQNAASMKRNSRLVISFQGAFI